ncbi:GerAB/ArcD/ProY family transporter [Paenibacillus mendelii]|uniref:Endospore germination permease n=1 Tax=Paenibacillus mendelii TaxID=206163 RepID=A0ABV6JJ92_9BACL|nr:endospore germination permease [Paenibacillus mendelii]MCQ6557789.1 spore germination protein [Paenibacillus mendelii]
MINAVTKISFFQACLILMLAIGLTNHVIINPMLLDASGRDAWIAVLLAGACYLPWCALLVLFMRNSGGQKLQPWLASRTASWISWILVFPLCVQVYLIGCTTIINTETWTLTYYLPDTPKFVLVITLSLVCFYYARSGIRMIAYSSGILLPIVIVLGYFVSFSNSPNKDYTLMKPILEHGWQPALNGMLYAGGGFIELVLLLTIQHRLKSRPKVWQLVLLAAILVYITVGPVIGAITEFGHKEAAKQFESPYEQWRLVKLGNDLEHVDFLSVFQWMSGAVIRVSFAQYILAELLPFRSAKARDWFILFITVSYITIAMYPIEQHDFYRWMTLYYFPVSLLVAFFVSAVYIAISLIRKKKGKEQV